MTEIETITGETVDVGLIQSFIQELPEKALRFGVRVLLALLVFVIGAQLIKLVCRILKKSMQRGNADVGVIQFLGSFVRITLYVILVFFIASGFGTDAASVGTARFRRCGHWSCNPGQSFQFCGRCADSAAEAV